PWAHAITRLVADRTLPPARSHQLTPVAPVGSDGCPMSSRRSRGWWMLGLSVAAAGCNDAPAASDDASVDAATDLGLRYLGTAAAAPRGPSLRATCVGIDGTGDAVYQVVHRYVPSVAGRLRVSLDDAATAANFDTVLFAQRDCFSLRAGENPLECNDDV